VDVCLLPHLKLPGIVPSRDRPGRLRSINPFHFCKREFVTGEVGLDLGSHLPQSCRRPTKLVRTKKYVYPFRRYHRPGHDGSVEHILISFQGGWSSVQVRTIQLVSTLSSGTRLQNELHSLHIFIGTVDIVVQILNDARCDSHYNIQISPWSHHHPHQHHLFPSTPM
jgi:hypothetical protein